VRISLITNAFPPPSLSNSLFLYSKWKAIWVESTSDSARTMDCSMRTGHAEISCVQTPLSRERQGTCAALEEKYPVPSLQCFCVGSTSELFLFGSHKEALAKLILRLCTTPAIESKNNLASLDC